MAKQRKYLMSDETRRLADDVAKARFHSAYADLTRSRKITVADHIWEMGLPYQSRALKDELGVAHG